MLSIAALRLEHLLDEALDDVNHALTLLPHRVQLPFESAHCLLDLHADHLVELIVLLSRHASG